MIDELKKINKKMSQEKMARLVGVSLRTITRWLKHQSNPSVHVRPKLEKFLEEQKQ